MRKNKKNLLMILASCIVILMIVLFLLLQKNEGHSNIVEQSLHNTVVSIQKKLNQPINYIKSFFKDQQQVAQLIDENNKLKQQVIQQNTLTQENQRLFLENKKLQSALNYRIDDQQVEKIGVNIIANNPMSFHKEIMIDRGEKDGLQVGMPILNSQGIIGEIITLGQHTATVKLLTSGEEQYHISVMLIVDDKIYFATIKKFDYKTQKFILSNVPLSAEIPKDTLVVTSGLSDKYPKGLIIGKLDELQINQYGLEKEGTVTPNTNYQELTPLYVVKYNKNSVVNEND